MIIRYQGLNGLNDFFLLHCTKLWRMNNWSLKRDDKVAIWASKSNKRITWSSEKKEKKKEKNMHEFEILYCRFCGENTEINLSCPWNDIL